MNTPLAKRIHPGALASENRLGEWFLVDVRTPGEFREAHIEGSLNAPLGSIDAYKDSIREKSHGTPVALVCRTGRRAQDAVKELSDMGFNVAVLEGGLGAWEGSGLPLLRGEKGMSMERQVRVAAGSLVVVGIALATLIHPWFLVLSAFVGGGLVFSGLTDSCGMAMVLMKLPWNRGPRVCRKD